MSSPRLLLFFSVLCAVISITPLGDDWQVLVRLAPEWTSHPNGYPYLMPHEHLVQAIVNGWQSLLQAAANSAWLTDAQAAALMADGLPMNGVLQSVAATLFVLAAFLWAVASVRSPKAANSMPSAESSTAELPLMQEPMMPAVESSAKPIEPSTPAPTAVSSIPASIAIAPTSVLSEPVSAPSMAAASAISVEQRLAALELQVANLLLNPDAQPVAEELVDLNRDLRELSRAVKSSTSSRS